VEIVFDPKILACDKHKELLTVDYDTIVLFGGRGAGKTLDLAKILVKECLSEDYFNCVVVFANSNKIKEGVYSDIKRFIVDYGLGEFFTFTTSPLKISCVNGNQFIFRGGKESDNAKGISEPNRIWFEEANNIEEDNHDIFLTSLRSQKGNVKRYYSLNPEAKKIKYKDHWMYKRFFEPNVEKGINIYDTVKFNSNGLKTVTIHSTFDDNPYCPESLKNDIEAFKTLNPTKYKIWRHGKWSAKDNLYQFAHLFKEHQHVKEVEIKDDFPIHLSFDQNKRPYSSCLVFQTWLEKDVIKINIIDEICLPPPANSSEHTCEIISRKYSNHRMLLYGDYSGNNENQKITKSAYKNHYDLIIDKLRPYLAQTYWKVFPQPRKDPRQDIVNMILEGSNGYELTINPKCVNTINDFEQLEVDQNGHYVKEKGKDKDGRTVEILAHCMDTFVYFVNGCYPSLFKR